MGVAPLCLLGLTLLQRGEDQGREQGQEGDDDEGAGDGAGKEGGPVTGGQHQRTAEVLLQNAAQDQAQNNGRDGESGFDDKITKAAGTKKELCLYDLETIVNLKKS